MKNVTERENLIDQLDRSFQAMSGWAQRSCLHALAAPPDNPATGQPFESFREILESASDETLEILRYDMDDNGDLLPPMQEAQ